MSQSYVYVHVFLLNNLIVIETALIEVDSKMLQNDDNIT